MRILFLRPLCIALLVCLAMVGLRAVVFTYTQANYAAAHGHPVVVFGDSHADDVPLPGAPRFNSEAQDLLSTYLHMRAFHRARTTSDSTHTVVLTIWPHKFGPLAERRLSGRLQADSWGRKSLGLSAPAFGLSDLAVGAWPVLLRWRFLLNAAQLKQVRSKRRYVPLQPCVPSDYQYQIGAQYKERSWFREATVSRSAFARILALVEEAGWNLVLLEHPIYGRYFQSLQPQAAADYDAAMRAAAASPSVTYLALGRDSLPHTAFNDFHHLTAAGGDYVRSRLLPVLEGLAP